MVICKQSVFFGGFTTGNVEILYALVRMAKMYEFDIVITSANDSKHVAESKHYKNMAVDVRSKNFYDHAQKSIFMDRLRYSLGPEYTVILEEEGEEDEHFHIQVKKGLYKP